MSIIHKSSINFLKDLSVNNNRVWFAENKSRYNEAKDNLESFESTLVDRMNEMDQIEKSKLFRIYRDVRFSKDKTPYNIHWSISISRQKPYLRGGYYFKITPEVSTLACGFWNPSPPDLKLIRENIDRDPVAFKKVIQHKDVKKTFGELNGQKVKTSPKGFSKDHPEIELLRFKQYIFKKEITTTKAHKKEFLNTVVQSYADIRPFFDYMSDILSHDLNGEPLY